MRIFIFGDSIVQGFCDPKGGWAQRLLNDYHELTFEHNITSKGPYFEVFNLGVSGDMASGIAARIEPEVSARHLYEDSDLIVLAVGVNDSRLHDNIADMDVYDFQANFERALDAATNLTENVLCVGLTAVDESLVDPSKDGDQFKNNRINLFEDTVKQSAQEYGLPFVPLHDAFLAKLQEGKSLLADGLHPNDAGHFFIYETVKPALDKLIKA